MTCETVGDLLLDYAEGELAPEQARAVEEHLGRCRACKTRYAETRALVGDMGAARSLDKSAWEDKPTQPITALPQKLSRHSRLGDYEIIEELGRGGMGVVYRARQISLNRIVALKLLSAVRDDNERAITRFMREAQAAARLHHTNIVPIYAQGREGDYIYYAMELIEGASLDAMLRPEAGKQARYAKTVKLDPASQRASASNLLRSAASSVGLSRGARRHGPARDYKEIARLAAGVAEGLHHAHEQGVVHRDIKPQNLLFGPDGELHITDFGLARVLNEPGLTKTTEMVGTPAYMSPEQITGPRTAIDRRTDIHALGATLYVMLTHRRPFEGESYEQTIHQILNRDPTPPRKIDSRIPPDLDTICLRAMEKAPHRRFQTAHEMARELRRYLGGFPIVSRPIGPIGKALRWTRRRPWQTGVIAAAVLLTAIIPLGVNFFRSNAAAEIAACEDTLLDDYREWERALAKITWIGRLGGDKYRLTTAVAFAHIRNDPRLSIELLEQALLEHPDDRDARYLLAWAYTRMVRTRGIGSWTDARRHIAVADGIDADASGVGWFFRGQAVWGYDPQDAERSFDEAIRRRKNFTQAMLHQGRAMNQIMYSLRDNSYYRKAVGRLESVTLVQPTRAYPRYLLATTHLLSAEIYRDEGKPAEAEEAYAACLKAAREAQIVESESPRGYAVEATYYESRGDYAAAIEAWDRYDNPKIRKSVWDKSERWSYQMRLYFWLGRYSEAAQTHVKLYETEAKRDESSICADDGFFAALIAAGAGDDVGAKAALDRAVRDVGDQLEYRLRLYAGYCVLGIASPPALLPAASCPQCELSPGWTPEWLQTLTQYLRGQVEWETVVATSRTGVELSDDSRLRMAGAWYFRGVRELAEGRRESALFSLAEAHRHYDNENYSYLAKCLLVKLQLDPDWPAGAGR